MYAVIKSGGKQHKVSEGEEILLEKLSLDEGEAIEFSEVLAVNKDGNLNVGKPLLEGAVVKGKVINHLKTKKNTTNNQDGDTLVKQINIFIMMIR